ncbi:MAG: DNA repair protein RecO [Acidobacteria bacterium]|nr:DNA repair protein RecO [Acidobacteriota bacterium]
MPIFEDEAIVLRQYPLAESDVIVVCIAPELGKIRAVAHGIKKTKSRFAGSLEPLNHIRIVFYNREGRELGTIQHAELIHSYSNKFWSLDYLFALTFFTELAQALVQENQPSPALFRLLLAAMRAGEKKALLLPLLRYFEVWCLKLSGFLPAFAACSVCGGNIREEGFFARIQEGTVLCADCSSRKGIFIGAAASSALQRIMTRSPEDFAASPLEAEAGRQIERWTQELLEQNLGSPLKSYGILKEIITLQGAGSNSKAKN